MRDALLEIRLFADLADLVYQGNEFGRFRRMARRISSTAAAILRDYVVAVQGAAWMAGATARNFSGEMRVTGEISMYAGPNVHLLYNLSSRTRRMASA